MNLAIIASLIYLLFKVLLLESDIRELKNEIHKGEKV